MKSNLVSKWVGASALALSLAIAPSALPVSAQVTPAPVDPTLSDDVAPDATYVDPGYAVEADNDFSWGWLGLLGLLGLAGLAGRNKDRTTTTYRTDDRVTTPASTDPRI